MAPINYLLSVTNCTYIDTQGVMVDILSKRLHVNSSVLLHHAEYPAAHFIGFIHNPFIAEKKFDNHSLHI